MAAEKGKGKMEDDYFGTPLSVAMNMPFTLEVGDIILGRISKIDEEFVYVSTGFKSEGRIPVEEFKKGPDADKELKLDDEVEVMVNRISGEDIYLSYSKVVEKRLWDDYGKKSENGEPIEGKITQQVKGGYRMDIGLPRHAFLPGSHLGMQVQDQSEVIEKTFPVLIIEFNPETENIVVSHRDYKKRIQKEKEGEIYENLEVGSFVEGKVTRLTNFGAFVDIGGAEGLAHVSELAWSRVGHPSQVLNCGDEIRVKVINVDVENKKISLSIKQAQEDPWNSAADKFPVDSEMTGTVSKVVKFGMFVRLKDDFEGLLHISEIQSAGEDDRKKFKAGDELKVKILNVDMENKRIKLGLVTQGGASVPNEMKQYYDNGSSGVSLGDMLEGKLDGIE
ncbi:MAG TPA: S1 RNA-binding domain-containing protein [bacterium]|nr:S1 RNA-binding domain-containing protein [bacterium]